MSLKLKEGQAMRLAEDVTADHGIIVPQGTRVHVVHYWGDKIAVDVPAMFGVRLEIDPKKLAPVGKTGARGEALRLRQS